MYVSARADYALRALATLAAHTGPMTVSELAQAEELPTGYLGVVLLRLRRAGILTNQRGPEAGYRFARDPGQVTAAEVVRAVDGLLAELPSTRPPRTGGPGARPALQDLWAEVQTSVHDTLNRITIAQLVERHPAATGGSVPGT